MSCYPDGCTPEDFDLAMMALGEPGLEEIEWSEPPEAEAGDPGPEFQEDDMRVSLIFDTERIFSGELRETIDAYLAGESSAVAAIDAVGWNREDWDSALAGIFSVARGPENAASIRIHPPLPPEVAGELAARISRICGFVDAELQDLSDSELTTVRDHVVKHYEWLGL